MSIQKIWILPTEQKEAIMYAIIDKELVDFVEKKKRELKEVQQIKAAEIQEATLIIPKHGHKCANPVKKAKTIPYALPAKNQKVFVHYSYTCLLTCLKQLQHKKRRKN